jgi:DNA-binding CsgD family transcriptional regulator
VRDGGMSNYGYTYEDLVKPRFSEIAMWVRDGLTERQIAKNLGISYTSFRNFKRQEMTLLTLLKKSVTSNPIAQVEEALISSASGQQFTEITKERKYDKKTKEHKLVVTREVVKIIPPNVTAQKTFLTAWKPDRYKNKQDSGQEGAVKLEEFFK